MPPNEPLIMEGKTMAHRLVEFPSEGASLRGRLYLPTAAPRPLPVVIMAHGFSATINGMVAEKYAEAFYKAGFAVLLYDHRNFGISGGEPRQEINKWVQARGYCSAMDYLSTLPEVAQDRIALWGDSSSGGEVIVVGSVDERVRAIVAQVPACGNEPPPDYSMEALFKCLKEVFLHGHVSEGAPGTMTGPLPVVSYDQMSRPSLLTPLTAFRWFMEYGGRYGTHWENHATIFQPWAPAPFQPFICAPHLKAPLLMMIAAQDEMPGANSDVARAVFHLAPEPKQKVEIEGGHFGLLHHPSELFEQASRAQCDFLIRHLK